MDLQRIERLIRKYENGDTTLKEERELNTFFNGDHVPSHLEGYRELFTFYRHEGLVELPDPAFDERVLDAIAASTADSPKYTLSRWRYPAIGIAAAILILAGIYVLFPGQRESHDTFEDPVLAYAEAKRILMKVSDNLNSGVEELSNMKEMQTGMKDLRNIQTFDEGIKSMQRISVLDKSKDILTQKNN